MSLGDSATPLGRVKGLGASGHGGGHWLEERFTSVMLVFLSLWLIFSLAMLPVFDQMTFTQWLRAPSGGIPMALLIIFAFRHGVDGLKVAVDDYVHDEGTRIGIHYFLNMAGIAGVSIALFALGKIVFGAAA